MNTAIDPAAHSLKETLRACSYLQSPRARAAWLGLGLAFFVAFTDFGLAQGGSVDFQNSAAFSTIDPTGGRRLVYDVNSPLDSVGGAPLAGSQWVAELYAGADAGSLSPMAASISRFRSTTTALTGRWGLTTVAGGFNNSIPLLFAPGTTVTLMVKVWNFNEFGTYEDAVANEGLTGASAAFPYVIPDPHGTISASYMEGLRAFALTTPGIGCARHKAQGTAQVSNGVVVGITLTDPGCGYTNPPVILIQGGGGAGATASAVIAGTQITAINVTSGGCCYTNSPTVLIASPWFAPTVSIAVSRVKITQHVVLGRNYVLESSYDRLTWTPTGPQFTADSETIQNEFDVNQTGGFFRVREVP